MRTASASPPSPVRPEPDEKTGVLLVVEGIDGVGKTTQVQRLAQVLSDAGERVTASREPTDGRWGRALRESFEQGRLGLVGELHHVIRDRRQHVDEVVAPALAAGEIVVLDRYFYSTLAYQGYRLADRSQATLERMERLVSRNNPTPDMVFVLDIPAEEGIRRISEGRGDRPNLLERFEALDFARETFRWLCRRQPGRLWPIDGTVSPEEIHKTILTLAVEGALWKARCGRPHGCDAPERCPRREGECSWRRLRDVVLPPGEESDLSALLPLAPRAALAPASHARD